MSTEGAQQPAPVGLPRLPLAALLLLSAGVFAGFLRYLAQDFPPLNDFHVLWSAARFLHQAPAAQVYDLGAFDDFRRGQGDAHFSHLPFLYPPCTALLLWPFAALPYGAALLAWSLLGLGLYLGALAVAMRSPRLALPALVAPAGVACLLAGQAGLLLGALAVLGAGWLPRRPLLAGVAFGLMALKPQLALLPGLVLLLAGCWRTAAVAAFTAALLVLASVLAFGLEAWPAWLHQLASFNNGLDTSGSHQQYGVSAAFALLALGLGRSPALAVQAMVTAAALWLSARSLRRGGPGRTLPLLPGLLLATPYAAVYDLPALAAACLLLAARGQREGFAGGELLLLAVAWLLPLLLLLSLPMGSVLGALAIAGVFALSLRRRAPAGAS